jgi:RNA polymerase sigma factor (sigma-70 family)
MWSRAPKPQETMRIVGDSLPKRKSPRQVCYTGSGASARRPAKSASTRTPRRRRVDEPVLLARVASGQPGAVQECIDRYGGLIWSLARRLIHTQAEAEDAVQEIFVEIWRNAWKYDASVASETAFVAMLARRRLIDRRRRLDRRHDKDPLPEAAPATPPRGLDVASTEEAASAARALEQLSTEQRRCLRLSVYEGLSHEKIAASTGLPLGTVKTHVRRGLIKIRQTLGIEGSGDVVTEDKPITNGVNNPGPNRGPSREVPR